MKQIELKNVDYYVADKKILENINIGIEAGDFLTLSGPSGSGKSTLLKVIASLITASKGNLLFEEKDQKEYILADYRKQVSYCFQQPQLFGETVRDNVAFPFMIRQKNFDEKRAREGLEKVKLPADFLDKSVQDLSGGEKQRVALLRNLMILPKVLLLDEVTTGLDLKNRKIIHRLIDELHQQGLTIIQVTHDEAEISSADRLIYIEKGELDYGSSQY